MALPAQDQPLACGEPGPGIRALGPPRATALREALRTPPEALALREHHLEGGPRAVTEDRQGATEGMVAEHLAAHGREPINALANIDGLGGAHDAAWRGQLEPPGVANKARTTASTGSCGSWGALRSRAPSGRCRAIAMPEVGRGQTGAAGTSTKPRATGDAGVDRTAWWATPRFFNSPPLPRSRVATRDIEHTVVKAMACSHREWGMGSAGVVRL